MVDQTQSRSMAQLYSLVAKLFEDRPNAALGFWVISLFFFFFFFSTDGSWMFFPQSGKLHQFLLMAGDIKQPHLIIPYAKMLSSLASGNQCAAKAYEFLVDQHRIHTYERFFSFSESQLQPTSFFFITKKNTFLA